MDDVIGVSGLRIPGPCVRLGEAILVLEEGIDGEVAERAQHRLTFEIRTCDLEAVVPAEAHLSSTAALRFSTGRRSRV